MRRPGRKVSKAARSVRYITVEQRRFVSARPEFHEVGVYVALPNGTSNGTYQ